MAIDVSGVTIPNRPFAVMEYRIQEASRKGLGGLLDGVYYDAEARLEPLGADRLPMIQPIDMRLVELQQAGAVLTGIGNVPTFTEEEAIFLVVSSARYRWVKRGDATQNGVRDWVARFMDTIELDPDTGTVDTYLQDTVRRPITLSTQEIYMSQLVLAIEVRVSYETVAYHRGGRTH